MSIFKIKFSEKPVQLFPIVRNEYGDFRNKVFLEDD